MLNIKKHGVPHLLRAEAFLDVRDMVKNPVEVFEKYRKRLGPTFSFHFGGAKPTIVTSDPCFIQHILKDNQENYNKSDIQVKRMAEFQGTGLLNSHGDYWFKQRRLLSMGFKRSHMSEMFPLQLEALNQFMGSFDQKAQSGSVNIHREMVDFTLGSVGKSLFGNTMKDEEIKQLGDTIEEIQEFIVKQIVQPYFVPWYRISGETEKFQKLRRAGDQLVLDYIEKRRASKSSNGDMLQIILDTPYKDGEFMTDEQVAIEILQLLVAGNETSSNALTWTFYLLAKHTHWQEVIRDEINDVFGKEEVNYKGLHELKKSINVLNEAMRIYPPFWMIDREANGKDEYKNVRIPKGTVVVPYIYGVHRNQEYWPDPEHFNPDRFEVKNHPFAHIPFGGGPRVCIGQNMAMMQILLVLAAITRKYRYKRTTGAKVEIHPMMILRPQGSVNLSFEAI